LHQKRDKDGWLEHNAEPTKEKRRAVEVETGRLEKDE